MELSFAESFKNRTKRFAIDALRLCDELPNNKKSTRIIGNQLGRSASSIAANYRAACVSRSDKEFVAKLCIVVEEADESCFWIELLGEGEFYNKKEKLTSMWKEANEITKIVSKSRSTAREKLTLNN